MALMRLLHGCKEAGAATAVPREAPPKTAGRTKSGAHLTTGCAREAMPWESLPPLIIIAGAVTAMGAIQQGVHRVFLGKPKAIAADSWDRKIDARDAGIKAATKARGTACRERWTRELACAEGHKTSLGLQGACATAATRCAGRCPVISTAELTRRCRPATQAKH